MGGGVNLLLTFFCSNACLPKGLTKRVSQVMRPTASATPLLRHIHSFPDCKIWRCPPHKFYCLRQVHLAENLP